MCVYDVLVLKKHLCYLIYLLSEIFCVNDCLYKGKVENFVGHRGTVFLSWTQHKNVTVALLLYKGLLLSKIMCGSSSSFFVWYINRDSQIFAFLTSFIYLLFVGGHSQQCSGLSPGCIQKSILLVLVTICGSSGNQTQSRCIQSKPY